MVTPLAVFHLSGWVPRRMWAQMRANTLFGSQSQTHLIARGPMSFGAGLFLVDVPRKARLTRRSPIAWYAVPGGALLALFARWGAGDTHQHPGLAIVSVRCDSLVRDGECH